MAFMEPYCHQAEIVSVPGSSPGCAAEACPGAGRRLEGSGGVGGGWEKREAVGPARAPGHLAPGPLVTCVLGPRLELRKSLRNPRGSLRWLTSGVSWDCQAPMARAPGPLNASAPSEERGLLTPAWPQAGHPAIPQKGHYRKCPPGSLQTVVSCFPWAQPKMADREAPPRWAVWAWGCLLCPQGP